MLFNSVEFFLFLPLVLIAHYALVPRRSQRLRKQVLLVASYLFYMSWNPPFALLLLASTLLDFWVARRMAVVERRGARRLLLVLSLVGNLGMLGYFKYGNFLVQSFFAAVGSFWPLRPPPEMNIFLPIGISFYTFQTLSYSLDVYRRQLNPTKSLLDFAVYVSFFPQLVAGPIVRARDFLPQLEEGRCPDGPTVERGIMRIVTGLMKKVAFADVLGAYVDPVFASPGEFGGLNLLLAAYAYAYQIYFDFSGYSDIAIGLCLLFGIQIPENFNRPYLAASLREFWRRWHISLSTWLRDYLYISLGGNRGGRFFVWRNLMVTMVLGGLWHGAAWTFVLWGFYHGVLLIVNRVVAEAAGPPRTPRWVRQIVTFHLVCIGWVFFRAQSLADALTVFERIATMGLEFAYWREGGQMGLVFLVAVTVHICWLRWRDALLRMPAWAQGGLYGLVLVWTFLFSEGSQRFIYFQF